MKKILLTDKDLSFLRPDSFVEASRMAGELMKEHGQCFLPVDRGLGVSPQYGVIRAPQEGQEVSKAFNGDSYPCGSISRISVGFKIIETDTGVRFYRRGLSATWVCDGTWSLVPGHRDERSREF
jgi:hypothetical protein